MPPVADWLYPKTKNAGMATSRTRANARRCPRNLDVKIVMAADVLIVFGKLIEEDIAIL